MVSQLCVELASEDARVEAEGLRLAEEWHRLKVAVSLAHHLRDLDNAKAEEYLVASRKACSRAIKEAQEADQRRMAAEERAGIYGPGVAPWRRRWSCVRRPLRR